MKPLHSLLGKMISVTFIVLAFLSHTTTPNIEYCKEISHECGSTERYTMTYFRNPNKKFLLYNVNPGEGFNLRRDVYMRVAALVHSVNEENPSIEWSIVLPPWGPLYHWKSTDIGYQGKVPWSNFFDLASLSQYVLVIEYKDFMTSVDFVIDKLYYLQHYEDMGESREWRELMEETACADSIKPQNLDGELNAHFWDYGDVYAKSFACLKVQGSSATLKPLLQDTDIRSILLDKAEVILHDVFGNANYWMIRRSMRFAKHLRDIGDHFRRIYLESNDTSDKTELDVDWTKQSSTQRSAIGGPYIGVHMRRQDFLTARPQKVPSIKNAAEQIKKKMSEYKVEKIFIATDASASEFKELKKYLPEAVKFEPDKTTRAELTDGGVAIVDQWICAHARFFMGSYESTFSFRIHEEREILGFPVATTFNRLCGDNEKQCKQPSRWNIVYP